MNKKNHLFTKKTTLINIISNLMLQIVTLISGFIVPKIILIYFGSNVNGLISSINQFLSYITLVEGGITGVISASLYKPLVDRNFKKVSSIINTSNNFYRKIGIFYIAYSFAVGLIYPIFVKTDFSYTYVFSLTLILSLNLLIQYMFSLSLRNLLNADKKLYLVSFTQIAVIIIGLILSLICVKIYPNIHFFKLINGLLFLLQPIVYSKYINKNYEINKLAPIDNELIKNRWNGFAINIAAFIHFSTDISILTIFTNLKIVSVYSVYSLVTMGLKTIITSISSGINPTIGQLYAKGNEDVTLNKFLIYEFVLILSVYYLFCIAGLLITPFIMIYTAGISDANYYQPLFGILLLISEALYLVKLPHLNLAYSANKFKEITKPAFIEAGLNIIISIVLVRKIGLCGIVIGTIIGMLYRMIFQVEFTKQLLKKYKSFNFYKRNIIFALCSIVGLIICIFCLPKVQFTIRSWLEMAFLYSIIFCLLYFFCGVLFFDKEMKELYNYFKIYRKEK